ncbi:hypothetical protein [Mammaliicoccus vitulinus]|uniref:hypothetical protein n=1 Tax=Mammaliicoccus vitulinus TaxID=71237 RepID=UPI00248D0932|nr:hypothetical protein [Mammaliicoccus vitulinus]
MLDKPLTILGNIIHFIGNIGMGIAIVILLLLLLYVIMYSKTDIFNHTAYMFKETVKKWLWIAFAVVVISALFHVLGNWVTPNVLNQGFDELSYIDIKRFT